MPHTFPKRRFRDGEVVAPDPLNVAFQDITSKLAGHIGEQDISDDVASKLPVEDEAYYSCAQVVKASDPDWTAALAAGYPYATIGGNALEDDPAYVYDATGWQAIQDDSGTDTLSKTLTCGDGDTLVLIALAQHAAWQGTGPSTAASLGAPLKLQYAFEVDGVVLENSITGAAAWPDPPPQQWYRATPDGASEFDYRHIQYVQNTTGISHAVGAHRLLYTTQVQSGSHTVSLKARRLPMSDYKVDSAGDGTTVQVFNRRLFILRIKGNSPDSSSAPTVLVPVFEDGDVLEATDLTTNGFTRLATEVNDLDESNIARGAFRYEHLTSVVYGAKATSLTPAGVGDTYTGEYPGYGTNAVGWNVVNDGAGANLELTGPTTGEWRLDTYPGTFVVMANVQVNYVKWTGAANDDVRAIGCFALRITNNVGTVTVLGETEVYVNGHSFDNEASEDSADLEIDVPLLWAVDSTTLGANQRIAKIEVVASVWDGENGTSPPPVESATQRGLLTTFHLKGVSIA